MNVHETELRIALDGFWPPFEDGGSDWGDVLRRAQAPRRAWRTRAVAVALALAVVGPAAGLGVRALQGGEPSGAMLTARVAAGTLTLRAPRTMITLDGARRVPHTLGRVRGGSIHRTVPAYLLWHLIARPGTAVRSIVLDLGSSRPPVVLCRPCRKLFGLTHTTNRALAILVNDRAAVRVETATGVEIGTIRLRPR